MPELEDTLAATVAPPARDGARPQAGTSFERGAQIGRYVVLAKLGAGAMGVVFAAYDPDLDRKLAIKLLIELRAHEQGAAQARLQREAQALAKLNHGNVVVVHDVGIHDGRVFVAMEFVEGQTLGEWMRTSPGGRPHPWREVLGYFEAAGQGLAAAHAVGLIHRDFKPDNVMLGKDGRVRVMDFGLARAEDLEADAQDPGDSDAHRELLSSQHSTRASLGASGSLPELQSGSLTRTGALMGTPAYMAPEQFVGGEVTARSDQFGFCVALYEALFGERPFAGESVAAIAFAVSEGALREPPSDARAPSWLLGVLARGLARDPEQRFADMTALLAALRSGETRRRRGRMALVLVLVAGLVAGALGWRSLERHRAARACVAEGDRIDELWSADAREAARAGLLDTKLAFAPSVADKVTPWLDAQAAAWREHATAACMHAEVDMSWDQATLARARWCLEDRRLELEVLVGALIDADQQIVQEAVQLAAELSPLEPCTDERSLRDIELPEPRQRAQLEDLHRELVRVALLELAGKYEEGLPLAREARARAETLGWAPMIASARVRESALLARLGDYEQAAVLAQQAYFEAARADAWQQAARAASNLTEIIGDKLARADEGLVWSEHAAMALAHSSGESSELREVEDLVVLSRIHRARGDYEAAEDMLERALATTEAALGREHPKLVPIVSGLGSFYIVRGDYERAKPLLLRSLEIWEKNLGPEHPEVARMLNNLGILHYYMGADEQAKAYYERALLICEQNLGPNHPVLGMTLSNLGLVYWVEQDYERSRDLQRRALAIRERAFDPTHPEVAATLTNLGLVYEGLGDLDEAARIYERVLSIHEQRFGSEHPKVGAALQNLASVHVTREDHVKALGYQRRALPLIEKQYGLEGPELAFLLTNMADTLGALERREQAINEAERAVAIREQHQVEPHFLAASEFVLAQLLWDASPDEGQDRERARSLAERAVERYAASDSDAAEAEVTRWLAEHP